MKKRWGREVARQLTIEINVGSWKVAHALLKSWGTRETPLMFVLLGVIMGIGISLGLCLGELAHVDVVLD